MSHNLFVTIHTVRGAFSGFINSSPMPKEKLESLRDDLQELGVTRMVLHTEITAESSTQTAFNAAVLNEAVLVYEVQVASVGE